MLEHCKIFPEMIHFIYIDDLLLPEMIHFILMIFSNNVVFSHFCKMYTHAYNQQNI